MRISDTVREVFYPLLVTLLIGTVWWIGYTQSTAGSAPREYWPALDPALMRRALCAGDTRQTIDGTAAAGAAATSQPAVISAIDPDAR
jgi:hypothetical protein